MSTDEVDEERRRFLLTATTVMGGVGLAAASVPFISAWLPSAQAEAAGAPVEVDLRPIEPGQQLTVEWRGKPVWIIRRTQEMLTRLQEHAERLRDPASDVDQQPDYAKNIYRSIKPEYLVLVGICTHLGCAPAYRPNLAELGPQWPGGFFCPCHGSTFDLSGRVYRGVPAPINLQVPPYKYLNDYTILIGKDAKD
jgi:ubiquinol-cytochrome c reductase iron-sulfur subunit